MIKGQSNGWDSIKHEVDISLDSSGYADERVHSRFAEQMPLPTLEMIGPGQIFANSNSICLNLPVRVKCAAHMNSCVRPSGFKVSHHHYDVPLIGTYVRLIIDNRVIIKPLDMTAAILPVGLPVSSADPGQGRENGQIRECKIDWASSRSISMALGTSEWRWQ